MSIKKVLLVDDSRVARMTLKKAIEEFGHEIICEAKDGLEGVEKYKELKPDLIICDVEMPNLDGYGLMKQVKEFNHDANVAIVSSVTNTQIVQKLLAQGAISVIKKPFKKVQIKKLFDILE